MKYLAFLSLTILMSCTASKPTVNPITNNEGDLEGIITTENLKEAPHKQWYLEHYNEYEVDQNTLTQLSAVPNWKQNTQIIIYLGTWCEDSHLQVPHLVNIFDELEYYSFTLIALDKNKTSKNKIEEGDNIKFVPTIVVKQNRSEIGRIVEAPIESLEKDLVKILLREEYTPNYYNE